MFGDSAGIDFVTLNNPVPINSIAHGRGSCASIADSSGNLLFYSYSTFNYILPANVTGRVVNRNDTIMMHGDSLWAEAWYNELVIVPRNIANNQFYIFSYRNGGIPSLQGLNYAEIDMNLDNGNGMVISKWNGINSNEIADCLQAVKHGNGRDWWLIAKLSKQNPPNQFNRFFVYLITPDSIHAPIVLDFNDATDGDLQKLIFHANQNKFMQINTPGYMSEFDFDRCTGTITLNRNIFPEQSSSFNRIFWEGAYSPSGNIFYVSTSEFVNQDTAYLIQYNLLDSNIALSSDTLDSFVNPIGTGAVRLAPDGKIYFSRAYQCNAFPSCAPYPDSVRNYVNENLSVINQPDSLGTACDYLPFSFYLGGKRTYYGLPNNPNYELGPLASSLCDTITSVGIEPNKANFAFNLYPNPTINKVTLNINALKPNEIATLSIYNNLGALLLQKEITLHTQSLDVTDLPNGIYFIQLSTAEFTATQKLVKME